MTEVGVNLGKGAEAAGRQEKAENLKREIKIRGSRPWGEVGSFKTSPAWVVGFGLAGRGQWWACENGLKTGGILPLYTMC